MHQREATLTHLGQRTSDTRRAFLSPAVEETDTDVEELKKMIVELKSQLRVQGVLAAADSKKI